MSAVSAACLRKVGDRQLPRNHLAGWRGWIGPAISAAILLVALVQLHALNLAELLRLIPSAAGFWLALAGSYCALPVSEWLIYRCLCGIPLSAILALLKKRIANEILLGYSGEVYFYTWMRRYAGVNDPLGIIKDVSILSAQAGNAATLAMLAIAWCMLGAVHLGAHGSALLLSTAVVIAMALPIFLFHRRLFSLAVGQLLWVVALHIIRIAAALGLMAVAWHEALPSVGLGVLIALTALRQLLSRLPLMPNKDLAFAGLVTYLIGSKVAVTSVVAMTSSLVVATHLVLGLALAPFDLSFGAGPVRNANTPC